MLLKKCAILLIALTVFATAQRPNEGSPIGINLLGVTDYSTQIPWYDMFMWFRGWENSTNGGNEFPADQRDAQGWITRLDAGQEAWVGHGAGTNGHFPGGNYLLTWEGTGTLETRNSCSFVEYDAANKRAVVAVDSTGPWFGIKITATTPGDYVKNIHMYMPGFWDEATYALKTEWQNDPWHPDFVEMLERFKCIRYMDWMGTNNSEVVDWADVKPGDFWNQGSSDKGYYGHTSPLWCIRLSNRLHADGWFCMPHMGTDACMREYATLIRDSLDADLKVYVELSNECWNWMFQQTGWCRDLSVTLGIAEGPAEGYAVRSAEMWAIFEDVFAGQTDRLVKVLAAQSGAEAFVTYMMPFIDDTQYNPTGTQPDVLSIAPYFSSHDFPISQLTHDQFFDSVMAKTIPEKRDAMEAAFGRVESLGLPMISYEGGQHFVGTGTNAVDYYVAVNQHPRMKEAYLAYLEDWFELGGGLFMGYASCGLGGQYGSWGCKEWYNQPRADAPKYDAYMTFIEDSVGFVAVDAPRRSDTPARFALRNQPRKVPVYTLTGRLVDMLSYRSLPQAVAGNGVQQPDGRMSAGLYLVGDRGAETRVKVR